jgi:hypothetical protein
MAIAAAGASLAGIAASEFLHISFLMSSAAVFMLLSAVILWETRKIQIGEDGKIVRQSADGVSAASAPEMKLDKSWPAKLRRISIWGTIMGLLFAVSFVGTVIRKVGWDKFYQSMTGHHFIEVIAIAAALFVAGLLIATVAEWRGWCGPASGE